ncbi:hypothetical protein SD074_01190 [Prolixibacter sp. SD074]|nr:hypothetical protein SD074_01190 [Prolixibacter sp. SD074]
MARKKEHNQDSERPTPFRVLPFSTDKQLLKRNQIMSFKVKGQIEQLLPVVTGTSARGEWKKQEFVVQTDEQYPKKICFTLFNDKINLLEGFNSNMEVEVSFSVESREYNGRWFHNVNAYRIDKANTEPEGFNPPPFNENDIPPETEDDGGDLPF